MPRRRVSNAKAAVRKKARSKGYASGFEYEVAQQLRDAGMKFTYEKETYEWLEKLPRSFCPDCGGAGYAKRKYTPDFFLSNGRIIEAKGRFTTKDRKIAKAMQEQGIVICYLFGEDNKLSRNAKSRYSDWCKANGLEYAIKEVPKEWLTT